VGKQGKRRKAKKGRLYVERLLDVPLREVSGVCLRRGRGGAMSLVAIGDRAAVAAIGRLPRRGADDIAWRTVDVARIEGSRLPRRDPQIEAVCADGAGRVLLLQEAPPRVELVDPDAARVVASIDLDIPGKSGLARAWADPKSSHGEGAVLMPGGHLLVAKEKDPKALVEFGPKGAPSRGLARGKALPMGARWPVASGNQRYVALAVWWPDKALAKACADFSDLEIGPDGRLYLLSDQSASIARLDDLEAGGGDASLTASWRIRGLDGKPEGLAFNAAGRVIVALDTRKARHNLALLEPGIAPAEESGARR
jgi:hypothetical protein